MANPLKRYNVPERKLNILLAIILLTLWAVAIFFIFKNINHHLPAVLILTLTGISIPVVCIKYPLHGFYFTLIYSSLFAIPGRLLKVQSPIGVIVEVFTYFLLIAVLSSKPEKKSGNANFWGNPITVLLIIIIIYYLLEIINPSLSSQLGWLFFVRKQISYLLFYFTTYMILDSYDRIKLFFQCWVLLVLVIALYGIKQQLLGFSDFEKLWLQTDPVLMQLYFQGGFLRKFSFLTDPAAFGIICTAFGLFTLVLAVRASMIKYKYLLFPVSIVLFFAAAYSGTRTCILMLLAGLTAYTVFTLNEKRTYLLICIIGLASMLLLLGPLKDHPVVNRIKSTLYISGDASIMVRDYNRYSIQPYILEHPFGGGLNTSGSEGQLYSPQHTLAGFPPDSGFMKILLEQGWVGLALHLVLYFAILKRGIDCFYKAVDPVIKNIYLALTICLFSIIAGQYSQIAIAQYPLILFYFSSLAVLIKLIDYDTPIRETKFAV